MDRKTAFAIVAALVVGYWASQAVHAPSPQPDRPVVRWIAKIAKNLLWVALIAEKPPEEPQPDHHVARAARIGDDGYPIVDNSKGW